LLEYVLLFCSGVEEHATRLQIKAVFRYREQEETEDDHDDFDYTAQITKQSKNIVRISLIVDSFLIEKNILNKHCSLITVVKRLNAILGSNCVETTCL
jgi:hypothetical protein